MQNFAEQCLDLARSILGNNLDAINEDGTISPVDGESPRVDEPGHAALALGEFYRATTEVQLAEYDLIDLAARCITAQAFAEEEKENGLAYAALGLLSFGPAKDRNPVWERLLDPTREFLDTRLLARTDYHNHRQAFNIAKAVARYSMGLSKKDETGRLIDRFIDRIQKSSTAGFCDDASNTTIGGTFDIYGVLSFVFIRQALQLHSNANLRERKLPSLRTFGEKYIKMMPDIVRKDGMGWSFGRGIGAYGQMHCISLILQGIRDSWISQDKRPQFVDLLLRLFHFFFVTFLDQEHGYLVIRDGERTTTVNHTTRMANFDAARYLCQWSRLARSIGGSASAQSASSRTKGRFIIFDKTNRKEQGVFIYQDTESSLHVQIPLIGPGKQSTCDSLAFPHCPGIFDWPADTYLPTLLPELKFGEDVIIPSFYGKRCVAGMGLRKTFYFKYEQPELISWEGRIIPGLGSVKVAWNFLGGKVSSEYIFTVKNQVQMDRLRYVLAIGSPHTVYHIGSTYTLGGEGLRCTVLRDDFQATWRETEVVSNELSYKSYFGNIHYLQTLERDYPLIMRPGQQYHLTISFEPDIAIVQD